MIAGEERELLYTLSLYKVLQDRKQTVVVEKDATWHDVTTAYLKMMYAAYINAIEVRQIDEPEYNPERAKFMDFVIWSEDINNLTFTLVTPLQSENYIDFFHLYREFNVCSVAKHHFAHKSITFAPNKRYDYITFFNI